jgi:hypothetical protein
VSLGLCSQIDLDFEVERASRNTPGEAPEPEGATLLPASHTTAAEALAAAAARSAPQPTEREQKREEEREADAVFAKLQSMKRPEESPEE